MVIFRINDKMSDLLFTENWGTVPLDIQHKVYQNNLPEGVSVTNISFSEYATKFPHRPFTLYTIIDECGDLVLSTMMDNWKYFFLNILIDIYTPAEIGLLNFTENVITLTDYLKKFPDVPTELQGYINKYKQL